jgi:hypothetical protein
VGAPAMPLLVGRWRVAASLGLRPVALAPGKGTWATEGKDQAEMDDSNQGKLPTYEPDKEQMLATYNAGREEMRFFAKHEWLITNYAVIAYAALVGGPFLADKEWHDILRVFAFLLVIVTAYQAWRVLWYTAAQRDRERSRLSKGIERLEWMGEIEKIQVPKRSKRPWWVRLWRGDREQAPRPTVEASQGTDSDPEPRPGLLVAVVLGAIYAGLLIISHLPGLLAGVLAMVALGAFIAVSLLA